MEEELSFLKKPMYWALWLPAISLLVSCVLMIALSAIPLYFAKEFLCILEDWYE